MTKKNIAVIGAFVVFMSPVFSGVVSASEAGNNSGYCQQEVLLAVLGKVLANPDQTGKLGLKDGSLQNLTLRIKSITYPGPNAAVPVQFDSAPIGIVIDTNPDPKITDETLLRNFAVEVKDKTTCTIGNIVEYQL